MSLLGMGVDIGNMQPRGPLKEPIGQDQSGDILDVITGNLINPILFPLGFHETIETVADVIGTENLSGDELLRPEHALQIRIDDVPLNEIELRNVYAASVIHTGIRPTQNPNHNALERAIIAAQAKIDTLLQEVEKIKHSTGGLGGVLNPRVMELEGKEIPNARSDLHVAEFKYLKSFNTIRVNPDPGGSNVLDCGPFEKAVVDARNRVNSVKQTIDMLKIQAKQLPPGHPDRVAINKEIAKLEKLLPKQNKALADAIKAFDDCKRPQSGNVLT
jgi:hypothetical protein